MDRSYPCGRTGRTKIHITGVVRRSELEGGFYAIRGNEGVTYDPTNLPPEFAEDGLQVEAEARRRDDMAGIHQVGARSCNWSVSGVADPPSACIPPFR